MSYSSFVLLNRNKYEVAVYHNSDATMPYEVLQSEILLLSYFQRFSYKQMAQVLSIPIGTVKSRLHTTVGRFVKDWKESVGAERSNDYS